MQSQDYDDPKVEARWIKEQREIVQKYLDKEEIRLVNGVEEPVWFVAPYVALWKTNNLKSDKRNRVWLISGDLPTDYFEASTDQSPRAVMLNVAKRWKAMSEEMLNGKIPSAFQVGKMEDQKSLGCLLKSRACVLLDWAKDDELWQ